MYHVERSLARRVVFDAFAEAGSVDDDCVGTEHILLGLIRDESRLACQLLLKAGVPFDDLRNRVRRNMAHGYGTGIKVRLTPRGEQVLELAEEEARLLGHKYVGPEHVLLGLIREGEALAARLLQSLGVELDAMRDRVRGAVANS